MTGSARETRENEVLSRVLEDMSEIVRADGGTVELQECTSESGCVVVRYAQGVNNGCGACAIDAETLRDFIVEALRQHDFAVDDVRVVTGQ